MNNNNKEKYNLFNDKSRLSDISTASTKTDSTPKSISDTEISFTNEVNSKRNVTYIKEVYRDNFFEEMGIISELIEEYNYIGMDTEFPGTVYNLQNITNDFYYKTLKINVDSLKLIQLGITITNEKGEYPKNISYHIWQFNFEFDLEKDIYNEESINLLKNSGINFKKLKKNGINHKIFAEYLMTSGLVLNPDIYWISYHGSYDFGYLLKLLINESLPNTENEFIKLSNIYFNNYYDVKLLLKDSEYFFNGGLNKLIFKLGVTRKGIMHQAGSDSIATIESFFALKKYAIINNEKLQKYKNTLYGLGIGQDNCNTINYTNYTNSSNNNNQNIKNININNNIKDVVLQETNNNKIYFPNLKQQIDNYSNNNYKINWYCPFVLVNTYGMINKNILLNNLSSQPLGNNTNNKNEIFA